MMKLEEAFVEQFDTFEKQLNGQRQSLLHQRRQKAMASFERLGFPTKKNEEYRYTQITRALEKQFDAAHITKATPDTAALKPYLDKLMVSETANVVVFVNGEWSQEHSRIISPADQVTILPLSEAYQTQKDLVGKYFDEQAHDGQDAFVALNTAFAQDGLFVHVPKGKAVEHPVLVYFISDTTHGKTIAQPRNLYVSEENSQCIVSESFHTIGAEASYHNIVSEIYLQPNAVLDYYKIEDESEQAYHTGTTQVYQSANSVFHAVTVSLNGAIIRNNLNVAQDASGCETNLYGLYMLHGDTHVDNHTTMDHRQPNTYSNELYKGIMDDHSHGVFNGRIYVRQAAQKTNAFQSNSNILLTDTASIDTKPQLEIWADDVKCSHGATTGQMDAEQVFYLRARGLSEIQAKAMLLQAFAKDVIQNIQFEPLRQSIEDTITARLTLNL